MTMMSTIIAVGMTALVAGKATPLAALQVVAAPSLVFDHVTVVDVDQGKLLANQRVIVSGRHIRAVGSVETVDVPQAAQVVDATGKYLIPGLWDMHTHATQITEIYHPLFIANGVTGLRDAGSPIPLDTLMRWRREILAGTRVGPPRQILSGQSVAGPQPGCDRNQDNELTGPSSAQTCVADSADARRYVDSLNAAGADMIKARDVRKEIYFVLAAEARRLRMPFGGHLATTPPDPNNPLGFVDQRPSITAVEAADSGARLIDHDVGWPDCQPSAGTIDRCRQVATHLRRDGAWFVPTRVIFLMTKESPVVARLATVSRRFWAGASLSGNWLHDSAAVGHRAGSATDSTQEDGVQGIPFRFRPPIPMSTESARVFDLAQRVGLPIIAGTDVGGLTFDDVPPGLSLHAELAQLVADGLSSSTALQAATLNPARFLGATDSLGTIAAGKLADLVLLDADPLTDITNTTTIRAVVANGRYYDRAALDRLLVEVQSKADQKP